MTESFRFARLAIGRALPAGLLAAGLAGCSSTGSYFDFDGFDPNRVASELSVFGLRGERPDRSQDSVSFRGFSLRADQQGPATETATGPALMTVYFGGYGYADDEDLVRDHINLSTFGVLSTDLPRRTDAQGGAEDSFVAYGWTPTDTVNDHTSDATLVLRNMEGSDGSGLQYATYGYWAADFTGFDRLVAFAIADANAGTTVPASGEATYRGDMTGVYSAGQSAARQPAAGDARLTVDFGARTVSGAITGIDAGGQSLRDVALAQTALSGTGFTGSAATLPAQPGQSGPALGGSYSGALYGPLAPEAVGIFALTGAAGEALVGGFAATR